MFLLFQSHNGFKVTREGGKQQRKKEKISQACKQGYIFIEGPNIISMFIIQHVTIHSCTLVLYEPRLQIDSNTI